MARFRFTLGLLLKLRRLEEDRAERAFLSALSSLKEKEAALAVLERMLKEQRKRCLGLAREGGGSWEVIRARRSLGVLSRRLAERQGEIRARRPALERLRDACRQASARRCAVEKLRELERREFLEAEEKKDRRDLDEAGLGAFLAARAEAVQPAAPHPGAATHER